MENLSEILKIYLRYFRSKDEKNASLHDKYMGISGALRAKITENWIRTQRKYLSQNVKRVYYISLEYNLGSPIEIHVAANELTEEFEMLKNKFGISTNEMMLKEAPIELGNNAIGDFSGNVLETLASNGIPSVSYGLWYEMGLFKQSQHALGQVEMPYYWDSLQHPWMVDRPEYSYPVFFGGQAVQNSAALSWIPDDIIMATPIDYPISGCRNEVVNTARFWKAIPGNDFRSDYFLHNDYVRACDDKADSTKFMRYLFNDEPPRQTSELHIKQQYFLASASVKDIIRRHVNTQKNSIQTIADKAQIYLSDCRCGFVIVEFIRVLVYDYSVPIKEAVEIAKKTFATSLMLFNSGEFQKCPVYIIESLLPVHMKIIYDMNYIILDEAKKLYQASDSETQEISLIEEGAIKKVRMANLLLLFSMSVSGFSQQAADFIKDTAFPNATKLFNIEVKSNLSAISLRKWLFYSNKNLAELVSSKIGVHWIADNAKLSGFEKFATDASVQNKFEIIKSKAKEDLVKFIGLEFGEKSFSDAMFVSQSGKISVVNSHLRILIYIACRYIRLNEGEDLIPRVYFFTGRAMPNDFYGKHLAALIGIFAAVLRDNPKLRVCFIHNRNSLIEGKLLAASDMSEYVLPPKVLETTAYNIYRCAANGVVTLTGLHLSEIQTANNLGEKCTFGFANSNVTANEYNISATIEKMPILQKAFDLIYRWISDFSGDQEEEHKLLSILSNVKEFDENQTLMLFDEYCKVQDEVDAVYKNKPEWLAMGLRNIARSNVGSLDKAAVSLYGKGNKGWANASK